MSFNHNWFTAQPATLNRSLGVSGLSSVLFRADRSFQFQDQYPSLKPQNRFMRCNKLSPDKLCHRAQPWRQSSFFKNQLAPQSPPENKRWEKWKKKRSEYDAKLVPLCNSTLGYWLIAVAGSRRRMAFAQNPKVSLSRQNRLLSRRRVMREYANIFNSPKTFNNCNSSLLPLVVLCA